MTEIAIKLIEAVLIGALVPIVVPMFHFLDKNYHLGKTRKNLELIKFLSEVKSSIPSSNTDEERELQAAYTRAVNDSPELQKILSHSASSNVNTNDHRVLVTGHRALHNGVKYTTSFLAILYFTVPLLFDKNGFEEYVVILFLFILAACASFIFGKYILDKFTRTALVNLSLRAITGIALSQSIGLFYIIYYCSRYACML